MHAGCVCLYACLRRQHTPPVQRFFVCRHMHLFGQCYCHLIACWLWIYSHVLLGLCSPFMDQCIKACCFEYQTRLWLAPPAPLCRTDCMWSLSLLHSNRLKKKCLLPSPSSLRTTVVLFNRSPSRPLLAQHAACRGPFSKQRSHMQNL